MTAKQLIEQLSKLDTDSEVALFWDGSPRGDIDGIYIMSPNFLKRKQGIIVLVGEWSGYYRNKIKNQHDIVWDTSEPETGLDYTKLDDGKIGIDSHIGRLLGFTSEKFHGFLWKKDNAILISYIESKAKGNFRSLVHKIHELGLMVKVPTPLGRMIDIVKKNGYKHTIEHVVFGSGIEADIDIWVLPPPAK